jgi:4-oxalocrotonate tautomerase family enzyme
MPTISVRLLAGRSDEQKEDFVREVTDAAVRVLRADVSAVRVEFIDVPRGAERSGEGTIAPA